MILSLCMIIIETEDIEMEKQLNTLLSDLVVEYHKLQKFHWLAKGKDFFQVHLTLEDIYNGINENIDEVAEKMLMSNLTPVAKMTEFLELTKIEEMDEIEFDSKLIFTELLKDFEYFILSLNAIKAVADKEDNYLISAMVDEILEQFAKSTWMIKQVLK